MDHRTETIRNDINSHMQSCYQGHQQHNTLQMDSVSPFTRNSVDTDLKQEARDLWSRN